MPNITTNYAITYKRNDLAISVEKSDVIVKGPPSSKRHCGRLFLF